MLGKYCANVLRSVAKPAIIPKRNFAQVGMVVSTPPRVPCTMLEKLLHAGFMIFVWVSPICYFETQLKVWRRQYVSPDS